MIYVLTYLFIVLIMKLYIGNKNYSSWSMRPWLLLTHTGIAFDEVMVRFDSFGADSAFKASLRGISPTGKVPVLVDGNTVIWDSLAIAEYVAEYVAKYVAEHDAASKPLIGRPIWPVDRVARATARSVCAEMHSAFANLRSACPMNIEARLPDVGALVWRDKPAVRTDVARLVTLWRGLLQTYGGPMLFGPFSVADAFVAPVCSRFVTYALPLPDDIAAYVHRVGLLPCVQAWNAAACAEHDFVDFQEPYRLRPPLA